MPKVLSHLVQALVLDLKLAVSSNSREERETVQVPSILTCLAAKRHQQAIKQTMSPYTGPLFNVQTHAIMPSTFDRVGSTIKAHVGLTDATKETMVQDICKTMADDLVGTRRIEELGAHNVHVVSVATFFPPLHASELIAICNRLNTWMASATAGNPQLIGIATLPPPPALMQAGPDAVEQGLDVMRRAIVDLSLKGIFFASNYNNVYLGDASFDPFFELAESLKTVIIIHPAVNPVEEQFIPWKNIGAFSGFLNDQRTTILDLVMAGVLEKYPSLTIIATHLGGGILTSLGRFRVVSARFPQELWYTDRSGSRRLLPKPIDFYLKQIFYDCNNAETEDILHAALKVGADHLLSGTDFPWAKDGFTRQALGGLEDTSTVAKIAYSNAAGLFSRPEVS